MVKTSKRVFISCDLQGLIICSFCIIIYSSWKTEFVQGIAQGSNQDKHVEKINAHM